jgi:hypothetical protein
MQAVASGRPDMLMMGDNAAKYGFVPNGGTSAEAPVSRLQAASRQTRRTARLQRVTPLMAGQRVGLRARERSEARYLVVAPVARRDASKKAACPGAAQ